MSTVADYLLMRTPDTGRMGAGDEGKPRRMAGPGKVSGSRIAFSLLGVVLGIVASFYVTGLQPPVKSDGTPAVQSQQGSTPTTGISQPTPEPRLTGDFSLRRLLTVGLISLVICGISYQGLYFSLRLYQHEPAWLIVFVSFQYGYFWQSVIKGGAAVLAS